jgi:hypothetical protein
MIIGTLTTALWGKNAITPQVRLDRELHMTVETYSVEAENLLQAVAKFSADFQVPIGVEWQLSRVPYKPINMKFAKTSVFQILAAIVAVEPTYTFGESNGVIHLSRVTLTDDKRNFLNIQIDNFELSSEYVFHANNRLRRLVVALANHSTSKQELGCAGSSVVAAGDKVASFSVHSVAVRDILDRLITSSGFSIWLVTFPEIPSLTPNGFFASISVFSPNLSESELPAWDLLLPGYDPVRKQMGIGWKQGSWLNENDRSASAPSDTPDRLQ